MENMENFECMLCLTVENFQPKISNQTEKCRIQEYLRACTKYLTVEVDVNKVEEMDSPLCAMCIPSVEKLFRIHMQLEEITNKMNEFSTEFSDLLNRHRQKRKTDFDCPTSEDDIKVEEAELAEMEAVEETDYFTYAEFPDDADFDNKSLQNYSEADELNEPEVTKELRVRVERLDTSKMKHLNSTKSKPESMEPIKDASSEDNLMGEDHASKSPADSSLHCSKCNKTLKNRTYFEAHLRKHERAEKGFPCHCGKRFPVFSVLKRHIRFVHTKMPKIYKCEACEKMFTTENYLQLHQKVHTAKRSHVCDICGKAFLWPRNLVAHKKYVHQKVKLKPRKIKPCKDVDCSTEENTTPRKTRKSKEKKISRQPSSSSGEATPKKKNSEFKDNIVKKKFTNIGEVIIKGSVTPKKTKPLKPVPTVPYSCDTCGKILKHQKSLENHKRLHTGEKPYQCDVDDCKLTFRTQKNLQTHHIDCHTSEYPFVCEHENCGARFKFQIRLYNHTVTYHPSVDKLHVCETCGKSFKRAGDLRAHVPRHFVEQKLDCTYCNLKCYTLSQLNYHVKIVHLKERKYVCDICGRRTYSQRKLDDHVRTHTGEKPFECTYPNCGRRYTSTTRLCGHRKEAGH